MRYIKHKCWSPISTFDLEHDKSRLFIGKPHWEGSKAKVISRVCRKCSEYGSCKGKEEQSK